MALHCPGWILCIFCANAARETIVSSAPLNVISKKYSDEIAIHYDQISPEFIQTCSEKILGSLVEVEAGESAEEVIRGYLYQKVKFKDDGSIRKLVGFC